VKNKLAKIKNEILEQELINEASRNKLVKLKQGKNQLEQKILFANEEPRVSDHAMLRIIERKAGYPVEELRKQVLTPEIIRAIEAGAKSVTIGDCEFKIKGKTITTVI